MAKIIDLSYFINGEYKLPNITLSETPETGISGSVINDNEFVSNLIDVNEYKFLISVIGFSQTKELYDQFEANGDWKTTAFQKYKDLVDGDESKHWEGLRYEIGETKISPIANFVFCEYLFKQSQGDLTKLGVSKSEVEHSEIIDPVAMFANAWNEMVEMLQTLEAYLNKSENWNLDFFTRRPFKNRYGL